MDKNKIEEAVVAKSTASVGKESTVNNQLNTKDSDMKNKVAKEASVEVGQKTNPPIKIPDVFIDGLVGDAIQGWAKKADTVTIFIEDTKIATVSCKEYREDLKAILQDPNSSFSYTLTKSDIDKKWLVLSQLSISVNFLEAELLIDTLEFTVSIEQIKEEVIYKDLDKELDVEFYKSHYPDLAELSTSQLKQHWLSNGKKEKRYQNKAIFVAKSLHMQFDFDYAFYKHFYPDLIVAGIDNEVDAKFHWFFHGKEEGRLKGLEEWLEKNNQSGLLFNPLDYDFVDVLDRNAELSVTLQDYLNLAQGSMTKPIKVEDTKESNARFYRGLGLGCIINLKAQAIMPSFTMREVHGASLVISYLQMK
ncbi:hypothetical protein [Psychromonas sp. KJ10-2]|uniref:hypothetical protein n=1 Tax=Psychromonas sp. KJ10-2 TaxID=3391822 RepID=UPI0039B64C8B